MIRLSILELGRVRQGSDRRTALDNARTLAQHAERLGFQRFWVAEHHNSPAVTTAATSVVVSHIAAGTTTIRVGAGGVMLPNHAPYVIAEQFGTLETLHPGRIDLGLGRAPGTDQTTLRALRRDPGNAENFPQDVLELQAFLAPKGEAQRIEAVPGSGTNVPLWILGSSLYGAQLAAVLGLPYAFGSQFSPHSLHQALELYRGNFQPSEQLQKPYAMIGVNVIAAETDDEARILATSQQMTFADMFRGMPSLLKPPVDDIEAYWTPREKAQTEQMLSCSVVGSAETVRAGLKQLVADTGADELMIVSDIFDFGKRVRSLDITAQAAT
ncbi:MAG TPA: LLM class flavin-dependent oxidoreductase [Shinella sp.]|jgi:luciferase family oxidoreductase group 1|uniref:LLM class flavin-dependent oxidoreductase n=1 Tax=Shinella TaxID=323620 RepID=UPI0007DAA3FB|nr:MULTISPECIES: LLM class flavin-dependent oxidoreductase [Shinella]CAI0341882.1 Alkane 1-monooxygenase [Rhizobiaceae bacterium]CAK7262341.1 Alkane 1-monooxygenase [Shinella sp. WSC3-e]ANH09052.1 alkane 1-monooxygenase [Shinella sp. HZN7]MDC7260334.1 LLM class flavin-dependent oxidoreductase [Shinella sp. YE25]HEV7248116.1 LLM class flavin-dependent oxidoreductase [Shinella sp.]